MIFSKLTVKHQTTIPKKIRDALKLKAGDIVVFEINSDGSIILKKSHSHDLAFTKALSSTLSEWESKNDEEAYRDL